MEKPRKLIENLDIEQVQRFLDDPVWLAIVENLEESMDNLATLTMDSPTLTHRENLNNKMFYKALRVLIQRPLDVENYILAHDLDLTTLLKEDMNNE